MNLFALLSLTALTAANPLLEANFPRAATNATATPISLPGSEGTPRPFTVLSSSGYSISCGPGDGVWVPGWDYVSLVNQFCEAAEGCDISDGYSQSDTYLTTLSPQGKQTTGDAGKVIFAIKNNGERPAYHVTDWLTDCADQLRALLFEDCYGKKEDTKGGTNKVGSITFEATIKKGDTW